MTHPLAIIGYAAFLWWFSTGLILFLNRRPTHTFSWSLLGGTLLFGVALMGLLGVRDLTTVPAAFCAFSCGLIAWGWQELTFYLGTLTGPRKHPCKPGCSGWKHFGHALQVSLYHEISIAVTAGVLVAIHWDAPNKLGLWTFLLVMVMHQSARVNVFLGVRNVTEEWVPEHLPFLRSFLNNSRWINPFWPISQALALAMMAWLVYQGLTAQAGTYDHAAWLFLSAMMGLAIVEHWFLVLPLPLAALWRWWEGRGTKDRKPQGHPSATVRRIDPVIPETGGSGLNARMASSTPGRLP